MDWIYFVSFADSNGFGRIEIVLNRPMDCEEALTLTEKMISEKTGKKSVIINFQLLLKEAIEVTPL